MHAYLFGNFDRLLYCRHNFLALTFYTSWHYDHTHHTESICLALSGLVPLEVVQKAEVPDFQ